MKLGILGAGGIASTMAKTVAGMEDGEAYAAKCPSAHVTMYRNMK